MSRPTSDVDERGIVAEPIEPQHVGFNLSVRVELTANRNLHCLGVGPARLRTLNPAAIRSPEVKLAVHVRLPMSLGDLSVRDASGRSLALTSNQLDVTVQP
jgi:hypothetical protein